MTTYRIWTRPTTQLVFGSRPPALTVEGLVSTIANVTVHEFAQQSWCYHEIYLELQRDSHQTALDELAAAVAHYGLDIAQAVVQEWVDATVEGAFVGGGTGFLAGGGKSNNLAVGVLSGLIGLFVGAALGSLRKQLVAEFDARRYQVGAPWVITRRNPPPKPQPGYAY